MAKNKEEKTNVVRILEAAGIPCTAYEVPLPKGKVPDGVTAAGLLGKPVGRLSGGELQRVLLAVATLPQPDLLILDEPVSGVDNAGLQLFYEQIDRLRATADLVILLISHDLDYVRRSADRVLLLDTSVKAVGTPAEVFASPAFRDAFPGHK